MMIYEWSVHARGLKNSGYIVAAANLEAESMSYLRAFDLIYVSICFYVSIKTQAGTSAGAEAQRFSGISTW